ncbi:dTDP-4-deoxyrhamnose-3,5-epimerase [Methylocella tundrae]|uniref:dTDP-4-dehydrorhamnose 3,5-epimerase n=1 Tax=Methylocella tundrae TaxID=227605 RepID=A0A8B6M8P8_METTU|nr:dTDP-4-dehydrorhamnose 3,5-epimerase [Methylocella tundrae]VTZ51397.1 dTDP-4-deoxyrhamnose-3,5-epimerase [Methylocella tundrae]
MKRAPLEIADVIMITPHLIADSRGYFSEVFKAAWFNEHIADAVFLQDNQSLSAQAGTIRGLHFQMEPFAQGKLVRAIAGRLFDVAVDLRGGSPTYGKWVGVELSADNGKQLWIPPGFAHGFATLEPNSIIHYKVTAPYSAAHDRGIRWNDPAIGVEWPVSSEAALLSDKDRQQPFLGQSPYYFHYRSLKQEA